MSSSAQANAPSKTTQVQSQVDEVIGIMHNNIEKVMARGEKLESLQNKTDDLQQGALQFKRGATKVRRQMWWKDLKLKLIIAGIVIVILIVIIVPIVTSMKSKDSELLQSLFALNNDTSTAPPPLPIDPVIFRHLIAIRKLVDDASELVIKAAGGGANTSPLGIGPQDRGGGLGFGGGGGGGGGSMKVSAVRQHRLRELAVAKLAKAYRIDEVATSVLTMQSASALDDVAAKVLKKSPNSIDAIYVHHFHEKIPSRMLAASTTTESLDKIIQSFPAIPEYYRTRAMIRCFREEYALSLKDFKLAIALTKKRRRNVNGVDCEAAIGGNSVPKGQIDWEDDTGTESSLYFLRGACFHQFAVSTIEKAVEKVNVSSANEGQKRKKKKKKKGLGVSMQTLIQNGTELDESGPNAGDVFESKESLNGKSETKPATMSERYAAALGPVAMQIAILARRSIRDYTHFLTFFPNTLPPFHHTATAPSSPSTPNVSPPTSPILGPKDVDTPIVSTLPDFLNSIPSKSLVVSPTSPTTPTSTALTLPSHHTGEHPTTHSHCGCNGSCPQIPPTLGTYHPLLVEAWYAIGLNYLLLGDWRSSAAWHEKIAAYLDTVEGYPVFLPARSMSQADYVECLRLLKRSVLERGRGGKGMGGGAEGVGKKEEEGVGGLAGVGVNVKPASDVGMSSLVPVVKPSRKPNLSVSTNGVGNGASTTTSQSNLRNYPLHTKRADTVMIYLQYLAGRNAAGSPAPVAVPKSVVGGVVSKRAKGSPLSSAFDEEEVGHGRSGQSEDSGVEWVDGRIRKGKRGRDGRSAGLGLGAGVGVVPVAVESGVN
ncbi:hypothetical protein HDV00_010801 [Rhizophlyctis rosea]|nr:hypothetical protein HDV00_010801 [Rhizophlyctis rosea]